MIACNGLAQHHLMSCTHLKIQFLKVIHLLIWVKTFNSLQTMQIFLLIFQIVRSVGIKHFMFVSRSRDLEYLCGILLMKIERTAHLNLSFIKNKVHRLLITWTLLWIMFGMVSILVRKGYNVSLVLYGPLQKVYMT